MPEWSYEFSWSDVLNGAIGSLIVIAAVYVLRNTGGFLWRQISLGRAVSRRVNHIELRKRVKSETYFATSLMNEISQTVMAFGSMILTVAAFILIFQIHSKRTLSDALVVLFVFFGACIAIWSMARERALNEKATQIRMRIERKKKGPRTSGGRKINSLLGGAAPRSAGLRPEPPGGSAGT